MSLVVLDTDAASNLLRRRDTARLTTLPAGHVVAITFVTVGEMTRWTLVRHWGRGRRYALQRFLEGFLTLPHDKPGRRPLGPDPSHSAVTRPAPANQRAAPCAATDPARLTCPATPSGVATRSTAR